MAYWEHGSDVRFAIKTFESVRSALSQNEDKPYLSYSSSNLPFYNHKLCFDEALAEKIISVLTTFFLRKIRRLSMTTRNRVLHECFCGIKRGVQRCLCKVRSVFVTKELRS
eukprot:CFRG5745T1